MGLLAGELDDEVVDGRHPRGASDEHDVVDVLGGEAGVRDGLLEGPLAGIDEVGGELLELRPRELQVEVLRALVGGRDEGEVDRRLLDGRQLDLGLLGRLLQALQGHLVVREVDALGVLEGLDEPVDDALVPVVTAEMGVARGRLHLEDAFSDLEDRDVEGAAAEVEHEHGLVGLLLVEAVGERGRRRLVDDAEHLEPGDLAGLLGGGALGIVEVGRHGDDGLVDGVAEERLGVALQLLQDPRRDLLGLVGLAVDVDRPARAHLALDRADGPVRVRDRLALGDFADKDFAGLGKSHDGRSRAPAFCVRDDCGLARLQERDNRVGRSEVDSDGLGHCLKASTSRDALVGTRMSSVQDTV